ncbi:Si-specific NAD(P)(+) transhydrogenase [Balneolaceae bacterium ANBcel3]|nr:Si-specific NAD(P)(+) transhydrogenase [Balneolaceae bacterium ANBcel3]
MNRDYHVIILGSGPAGFSCAMQSSKFEKKALIVEANERYLGGSWINTGTVPSKALRETANNIFKHATLLGDEDHKKPYERFKMRDVLRYKDSVLASENSEIKDNIIKNGIDTEIGYGKIIDKHTVKITKANGEEKTYTTDYILISTGTRPLDPSAFEIDHTTILDNRSILDLHYIPKRLVIIGTNVQAIEFATIFSALGTNVSILSREEDYLLFLDKELKAEVQSILDSMRVKFFNRVQVKKVGPNPVRNCTEILFENNDDQKLHVIETEQVLYFGARKPNSEKIGLENVQISSNDEGYIEVDRRYQTNVPNIYAAGDVIGHPGLASVSFSQGRIASCHMFGIPTTEIDSVIPYGIYSIPEIASIGLTEEEARQQGYKISIGRSHYKNLTKANIAKNKKGLLKLVFETETLRLLGVHIVGESACELIHIGQAVLRYQGDIRYFLDNVHNYPTYSEAYRIAAFNGVNQVHQSGITYDKLLS